jgi:hypothetical protein
VREEAMVRTLDFTVPRLSKKHASADEWPKD